MAALCGTTVMSHYMEGGVSGHVWRALDPTDGELEEALPSWPGRPTLVAAARSNWEGVYGCRNGTEAVVAGWWADALGRFHWMIVRDAAEPLLDRLDVRDLP